MSKSPLALASMLSVCGFAAATGVAAAQCGSSQTVSACNSHEIEVASVESHADDGFTVTLASSASYDDHPNIVETAVADGRFTILAKALGAAGLVDALQSKGPFTVFAPTDDAFMALEKANPGTLDTLLMPKNRELLTQILTYHVVAGEVKAEQVVELSNATTLNGQRVDVKVKDGKVYIDGAQVVITDIETSNGIIHVIDSVITPNSKDIVETAMGDARFSTLVEAVKTAGLVSTLQGDGPFTVFAPTNEAFAKVPGLSSLLEPRNRQTLVDILTYHVVPGSVYARDAVAAERASTVQGEKVKIGIDNGRLTVNGANIIITDIETTNGVIHVIDAVITPPSM
jgi:transforming growth factor-beta-induced protein